MTPQQIVEEAIKPVAQVLKSAGFKKSGHRFLKDIEDGRVILEVQSSQWNQGNSASFTINLAVFAPELLRKLERKVGPKPTTENGCTWHERIGFITTPRSDLWWEAQDLNSAQSAGAEAANLVARVAIPWLESAATFEGLCAILKDSGGVPAADLLWSLGRHVEAEACIKLTPQNTSGRVRAVAEWLAARGIVAQ